MASESKSVTLSELQLDVMRVLWRHGEVGTTEVVEALERSRGLAHTTVATLLSRLEKRGVVASRREGRQLLYQAKITGDSVQKGMVSALVSRWFGGDAKALVAHLVREEELAPDDLATVRRLLKQGAGSHD